MWERIDAGAYKLMGANIVDVSILYHDFKWTVWVDGDKVDYNFKSLRHCKAFVDALLTVCECIQIRQR